MRTTVQAEEEILALAPNRPSPLITCTLAEADARPEVCEIDIENAAGVKARYWISVVIKRGRPHLVMTTKLKGDVEVTKSVAGAFNRI